MLARKMKSCLDVTILVGITTIAGDLILEGMPIKDQKSKYFDMKLGGGVATEMTSLWKFTSDI